ncbi:hypothetical protein YC2023_070724 [Brassica napus]
MQRYVRIPATAEKVEKVIEAEKEGARDLIREHGKEKAFSALRKKRTQEELLKQVDLQVLSSCLRVLWHRLRHQTLLRHPHRLSSLFLSRPYLWYVLEN